jgi:hypothetical protein
MAKVPCIFKASGFDIKSADDFKAIPDDQWDNFSRANTTFPNWHEMLGEAGTAFVKMKPGF